MTAMTDAAVPALKDPDFEKPVPSEWRPVFAEIVRAFVAGDYAIKDGIPGVAAVESGTAKFIEDYIAGYGDVTLVELTAETWETSVAMWQGTHWDVLVDLRTTEEGRSDLVLGARVTEVDHGVEYEIEMVYVP